MRRVRLLLLAFLVSSAAQAEVPSRNYPISPIKVGAILAMTGEWGSWGVNCRQAAELAVEQVNSSLTGRTKIELLIEDSPNAKPTNALTAFRKLTSVDKVEYIFGLMSPEEYSAVAPLAEKQGLPVVSFVSSRARTKGSILVWMDPEIEAQRLAQFVAPKGKKVAILSSNQDWESQVSHAFAKEFERLGGVVVLQDEPPFDSTEVKAQANRAKAAMPDLIFVPSYLLFSNYLRELATLNVRLPIYSIELDQNALNVAGKSAQGVIFIKPSSTNNSFSEEYQRKFKSLPDIPAAQCYDGIKILADVATQNKQSVSEIEQYLLDFPGYNGASGRIEIRAGKTTMSTGFFVVRDGLAKAIAQ